jgi:hypothetical protein
MSEDDPLFAQRAFLPSNVKAGSEAEDEAMELLLLQEGYPAQVKPNEDHATRIHVLMGWLQKQSMMGLQVATPQAAIGQQRVQQHLAVHWQYLQKLQPQVATQLKQQIQHAEAAAVSSTPGNAARAAMNGRAMQPVPTGANGEQPI